MKCTIGLGFPKRQPENHTSPACHTKPIPTSKGIPMYIPQKIKTLIWLVLIAIALFDAYQIPAVRTLVNRTAAKQGIDIDKNSPEAQIRRLKGSYDDRDDSEVVKENIDRKVQQFRDYGKELTPNASSTPSNSRVRIKDGSYSDQTDQRRYGKSSRH